ncbi:MAG: DUF3891 family protein [Candidatus Dadabacteria bacterium]|nr:MAG: DUF3891 family protein [Candidatus Dadabacteria bacterium]
MIVQIWNDHCRLITQEQHALLSGVLAEAWADGGNETLHPMLRQAIGLHDNAWRAADRAPRWNPDTSGIHDFVSIPDDERLLLYGGGLDQLERVHPYIAALVSMHYTRFSGTVHLESLQKQESARRERLAQLCGFPNRDILEQSLTLDLKWLQFFDALSLWICLTTPGIREDTIPAWITPERWAVIPGTGQALQPVWADPRTVRLQPFPCREPFQFSLYFRRLPATDWPSADALEQAWADAPVGVLPLRIEP